MQWKDINGKHPPQLKIILIAVMPHKSRPFRIIQNLSNEIKINNVKTPSFNQIMVSIAPEEALQCIGQVLLRMMHAVATVNRSLLALFTKADAQD